MHIINLMMVCKARLFMDNFEALIPKIASDFSIASICIVSRTDLNILAIYGNKYVIFHHM